MNIAHAEDQLYSIADIARHFSLPESTCRYYCKRFSTYIPSVGEGRRRRYRSATIDVISAILEEMKKSRTANAVEDALAIRFPRNALTVIDAATPKEDYSAAQIQADPVLPPIALTFMERQAQALEGIAKMLNMLTSHLCATHALPEAGESESIAELKKEVSRLSILLEANEKNQQADLEQLRTWMGRFLRRTRQPA